MTKIYKKISFFHLSKYKIEILLLKLRIRKYSAGYQIFGKIFNIGCLVSNKKLHSAHP